MKIKSTFISLFKKEDKLDAKLEVFENGSGNEYPETIELLINNSVTAKQCSNTMTSFIAGRGFGEKLNKFKVNKKKGLTLFDMTLRASSSISRQRGIFIHVNFNLNFGIASLDVLPFSHCRIGKKDDNDHSGKIGVCQNWKEPQKNPVKYIDAYNSNKNVLINQINACEGESIEEKMKNYKGQIMFISMDYNTIYPFATIDAVQEDCDSESQAAIYKNRSLRKGFFGKTMVITKPMIDVTQKDDPEEFTIQDGERNKFKKTLKEFIGAENNEGILHFELEFDDTEGIDKAIQFKTIETNIDDKLFAHTESSVSNNIRKSFNNIPPALVESAEGALFGSSGEAILEMQKFYQNQTRMERTKVVQTITDLMSRFSGFEGTLVHETLISEDVKKVESDPKKEGGSSLDAEAEAVKKAAQAQLKGSVGGVTALLTIQQSVKAGTTDRESALTIIEEIFGIDKELAGKMLGATKEEKEKI